MRLVLTMDLDNVQFVTYEDGVRCADEAAKELKKVALRVARAGELTAGYGQTIRDVNGNSIGKWIVEE